MKRLIVALTICILIANGQSGKACAYPQSPGSPQPSEIPTVEFCQLIRNPEIYDGKMIRLQATWVQTFEWSFLIASHSDTCHSQEHPIKPNLDCHTDAACKEMYGALNGENFEGDPLDGMRAGVVVVGRFQRRIKKGEARNEMLDLILGVSHTYYSLDITRIEEVKKMPKELKRE